jgi:hypothetical protein
LNKIIIQNSVKKSNHGAIAMTNFLEDELIYKYGVPKSIPTDIGGK